MEDLGADGFVFYEPPAWGWKTRYEVGGELGIEIALHLIVCGREGGVG